MKIALSITCHESPRVIIDQCFNALMFFEDPFVIIHFNSTCKSIKDEFIELLSKYPDLMERVYVNTESVDTGKSSFLLHKAHMLNLDYLRSLDLRFDYFLLEASNSLFVRKNIEKYISDYDAGISLGSINGYWLNRIEEHDALHTYLANRSDSEGVALSLHKGCHEGSFFSEKIVDEIFETIRDLDKFCIDKNDLAKYPTEEVWFQLAVSIYLCKHSLKLSNTLSHMPWERDLKWSVREIEDFISDESLWKKFSIKRIERDIKNRERKYISQNFGYSEFQVEA